MITIYGDTEGTLEARAKKQTLLGVDGETNYLYGDAYLIDTMRGGNDVLAGGANARQNLLYGDAYAMSGSRGGNDVITGGTSTGSNVLVGDAYDMSDSQGGNDVMTGGVSSGSNALFGDANRMINSKGGNDVLTGGSGSLSNVLYGDAHSVSGGQGGDDALIANANSFSNYLYGDAWEISSGHQAGDDILIAGDAPTSNLLSKISTLYGDAARHGIGNVICGHDRLISGTGNDDMWGDIAFSDNGNLPIDLNRVTTGNDVFVFFANNGNDRIYDFRQGEDKIELQGLGVDSFDALMAASHLSQQDTSTVITFGANTITVVGVTDLNAADFIFT